MTATAQRRDRQRTALVAAAERAIAEKGPAGLKARDLAAEIGCALGAIYNLVQDMDELVLRVGSRTLGRLDAALAAVAAEGEPRDREAAVARLVAIAIAYHGFARDNPRLWRTLFEYRLAEDAEIPDWAVADQLQLFRHIMAPLALVLPQADAAALSLLGRTLFSAVHGVVALGLEDRLVGVPRADIDRQIEALVRLVCAGLAAGGDGTPLP
ncbi:TetR/AcrR family transcriptional regulator [Bosea sp. TWI1241]|uniref:TetR/AcrR family transcriptional regulator n=1 Tax=Bosea sp. TWI1241 TaxID=3148904 RepID=UPI00320A9C2B